MHSAKHPEDTMYRTEERTLIFLDVLKVVLVVRNLFGNPR